MTVSNVVLCDMDKQNRVNVLVFLTGDKAEPGNRKYVAFHTMDVACKATSLSYPPSLGKNNAFSMYRVKII